MAVETRGGRRYVYLSERRGGRPVKEYFGSVTDESAELALELARQSAELAEARRRLGRELREAERLIVTLHGEATALARATLEVAGLYRSRRHWRLRGTPGRPPADGPTLRDLRGDELADVGVDVARLAGGAIDRVTRIAVRDGVSEEGVRQLIQEGIADVSGPSPLAAERLLAAVVVSAAALAELTPSRASRTRLTKLAANAHGSLSRLRRLLNRKVGSAAKPLGRAGPSRPRQRPP